MGKSASKVPYVQAAVAKALQKACSKLKVIQVNSALRTLPQQVLLRKCRGTHGVGNIVALPGRSNHESGTALDIENSVEVRSALSSVGFRWFGPSDAMHYDWKGGGDVNIRSLSVKAFATLWNSKGGGSKLPENPTAVTDAIIAKIDSSPIGGFPGFSCSGKTSLPLIENPAPTLKPVPAPRVPRTWAPAPEPKQEPEMVPERNPKTKSKPKPAPLPQPEPEPEAEPGSEDLLREDETEAPPAKPQKDVKQQWQWKKPDWLKAKLPTIPKGKNPLGLPTRAEEPGSWRENVRDWGKRLSGALLPVRKQEPSILESSDNTDPTE